MIKYKMITCAQSRSLIFCPILILDQPLPYVGYYLEVLDVSGAGNQKIKVGAARLRLILIISYILYTRELKSEQLRKTLQIPILKSLVYIF